MPLFSRGTPPPVTTPPVETPPQATDVEAVVTRVLEKLVPMLQPQAAPVVASAEPAAEEEIDPEERQRITRVASDVTRTMTDPYAAVFNQAMPEVVRDIVVRGLDEGERIMYDRYKGEVDGFVARATAGNPSLRAVPDIHRNAIDLMLGKHSGEVARLAIERVTAQDLPTQFQPPNTTGGSTSQPTAATQEEQGQVDYYTQSSRRVAWDVETARHYRDLKPGYLHEMIAEHRAKIAAKQGGQT